MNLFISDKPVLIRSFDDFKVEEYDTVIDGQEVLTTNKLLGNVLVENSSVLNVERLINILEIKKLKKVSKITFLVKDKKLVEQVVKDKFRIIKAGGGIVEKEDKVLMIYRLKKWDLPKGKLKKKESPKVGACREVEEECSIKVELKDKLCVTWHTYTRKGKKYLKKINWYTMSCLSDKNMQPQLEEDIQEVKWVDKKEALKLVSKSYRSISAVYEHYLDTIAQSL